MKRYLFIQLFAVGILIGSISSITFAQETKTPDAQSQEHEKHHPKGQAAEPTKDSGMMGSMNMDDMKGMMHECMDMHKDGKMCNHDMMEKCQAKMGKKECKDMMAQMKKEKMEKKTK